MDFDPTLGTRGAGRCADCGRHSPGRWPGERCHPCWQIAVDERNGRVKRGPTALYRLYDADDQLLYIGISIDPQRRFKEHRKEQGWWPLVARRDIEWLDFGGWDAVDVERAAIRAEQPACNHGPESVPLPPGCPAMPDFGPWFDRAAEFREWRRWWAVFRDCRLNREELAALGR
jgi:predicted GIY-YIG superfamily endonuclease